MEEVRICDYCGMELAEDEGTYVDEELLCEDCVADHCITCDHCGETIWTTDCVTDDNSFLCQSCYRRSRSLLSRWFHRSGRM